MEARGDVNQKKTKSADQARTKAAKTVKTNGTQRSSKTGGKTAVSASSTAPDKAGTVMSTAKRSTKAGPKKSAASARGNNAAPATGKANAKTTAAKAASRVTGKAASKPSKAGGRKSAARKPRLRKSGNGVTEPVTLPNGYRPSEKETFMSPRQREYFRLRLLAWQDEILEESRETILHLQEHSPQQPDIADRASVETDRLIELRTRDRERKLMAKIDEALQRIEDCSYGFCEETGDSISLQRLEARPVATLSIDAQERHERMEKTYRDD